MLFLPCCGRMKKVSCGKANFVSYEPVPLMGPNHSESPLFIYTGCNKLITPVHFAQAALHLFFLSDKWYLVVLATLALRDWGITVLL